MAETRRIAELDSNGTLKPDQVPADVVHQADLGPAAAMTPAEVVTDPDAQAALSGAFATADHRFGSYIGPLVDAAEYECDPHAPIILDLTVCSRTTITIDVHDGNGWEPADLVSEATGLTFSEVNEPGRFRVLSQGAQVRVGLSTRGGTHDGALWSGYVRPTARPRFSPSPAIPTATAVVNTATGGFRVHPDDPLILYGRSGATVRKSTNGGTTFSTIYTGPASCKQVRRLDSGRLIAWFNNGECYRSDPNEENWELVHTVESAGSTGPSDMFGVTVYGSIIVYAEYGPNSAADNPRRVYASEDEGETWEKIFEGPQNTVDGVSTWHLHDATYDPYEDCYWVVNGDGPANSNVWVRKRGVSGHDLDSWTRLYEPGTCPEQMTTIVPLPSCVLFLSDSVRQSIWRYDRQTAGITEVPAPFMTEALTIEKVWAPEPISTTPFVDRTSTPHAAYFGWTVDASALKQVHIWATADGLTFHKVWSSPDDTPTGPRGIRMIDGPNSDGRMVVDYAARPADGQNVNLWMIDIPEWRPTA